MRYHPLICALLATLAAPAVAQDRPNLYDSPNLRIDSFGYLRSGLGFQENGDGQICFQLPGAGAKYRLGNECETYIEPGLKFSFGDEDNGPLYELQLRGAAVAFPLNDYDEGDLFAKELWIGARRIFGDGAFSDARIWAGHRFYKRQDVHINDFYWWDGTGTGAGIEDVDLGFATGSMALFFASGPDIEAARKTGTDYTRADFRLEDIAWNDDTTLTFGLDLRAPDDGAPGENGAMLTAMMTHEDARGGTAKLGLQAGFGAGHTLSFTSDPNAKDDWTSFRAVGSYLLNASDDFSVMGTAIAQTSSDAPDWYSLGVRPVWRIRNDWHFALEAGLDHVNPDGDASRNLGKLTAALEYKPTGSKFFSRPVYRAYVTHAEWDSGAEDAGIAPEYSGTSGTVFGVQVEHWW